MTYYLRHIFTAFALLALLINAIPLIFHPSIFMDEGFYLGASRSVMDGDIFLTQYRFDKPFLLPFWPVLGLAAYGPTPLGFRLVAILCLCASFFLCVDILNRISSKQGWITHLLAVLFSTYLFSVPLVKSPSMSAFCEPYLLLGTFLLVRLAIQNPSPQRISNYFFPFFFTKFSMVLWFPLFWKREIFQNTKTFFRWHLQFLKLGRFWLLAFLLFSLLNANKFGTIKWFRYLLGDQGAYAYVPFFQRIVFWTTKFWEAFGHPLISALLVSTFITTGILLYKSKSYRLLWILVGATLLHFAALPVLNSLFMLRYLTIILPVFLIACFYTLQHFSGKSRIATIPVLVGLAFLTSHEFQRESNPAEESKEIGRLSSILHTELNSEEAVVFMNATWETSPYRNKSYFLGCVTEECLLDIRKGAALNSRQYLFDIHQKSSPGLFRAPLYIGSATPKTKITNATTMLSPEELIQKILYPLKLSKAISHAEIVVTNQVTTALPLLPVPKQDFQGVNAWQPFFFGPKFKITGELKSDYGISKHIEIEGELGINDLTQTRFNVNQYSVIFRFTSAKWGRHDVTDIYANILRKYAFRIDALPVAWQKNRRIETLSFSPQKGLEAKVLTVDE